MRPAVVSTTERSPGKEASTVSPADATSIPIDRHCSAQGASDRRFWTAGALDMRPLSLSKRRLSTPLPPQMYAWPLVGWCVRGRATRSRRTPRPPAQSAPIRSQRAPWRACGSWRRIRRTAEWKALDGRLSRPLAGGSRGRRGERGRLLGSATLRPELRKVVARLAKATGGRGAARRSTRGKRQWPRWGRERGAEKR
jgi:hypothetical protein